MWNPGMYTKNCMKILNFKNFLNSGFVDTIYVTCFKDPNNLYYTSDLYLMPSWKN